MRFKERRNLKQKLKDILSFAQLVVKTKNIVICTSLFAEDGAEAFLVRALRVARLFYLVLNCRRLVAADILHAYAAAYLNSYTKRQVIQKLVSLLKWLLT